MRAPGGMTELPADGMAGWATAVAEAAAGIGASARDVVDVASASGAEARGRSVQWPAYPVRIDRCLGRQSAMALLDWSEDASGVGRIRHQEEYAEWRVEREDGRIQRIELTTELPEYWRVLAAFAPQRLLHLAARFAGENQAEASEIFGSLDPFDPSATPQLRAQAFADHVLNADGQIGTSPYNDGRRAICCMVHPDNNLSALLRLVSGISHPYIVTDTVSHLLRFPSGEEALAGLRAQGVHGRASDPIIAERLARYVSDGQAVALADPVGVYIEDVQRHELVLPTGNAIPASWFQLSRGLRTSAGRALSQRLTLTAPDGSGIALDDVTVRRTGEPLRHGGQLAELVQLVLYLAVRDIGASVQGEHSEPPSWTIDCSSIAASWAELGARSQ